jgi:hypothetical protein
VGDLSIALRSSHESFCMGVDMGVVKNISVGVRMASKFT